MSLVPSIIPQLSNGLRTPGNKPRPSPTTRCPNKGSSTVGLGSLGPLGPQTLSLIPLSSFVLSLLSSIQGSAHPKSSPVRTKEAQACPALKGRRLLGGDDSSSRPERMGLRLDSWPEE